MTGSWRRPAAAVASALGWALSALAVLLACVAVAGAVTYVGSVPVLGPLARAAEALVPAPLAGLACVPTPTGGLLRGDVLVAAALWRALGWVSFRVSASLR